MNTLIVAVVALLFSGISFAAGENDAPVSAADIKGKGITLPDLSKEHLFDGIDISKYDKFWEKWHLVTTRFRKDNNEQRFIFANPVAWKAMQSNSKVFPDGSMFGKVAFIVNDDPSFPNSLEPANFTRMQLMKKDHKAYKDSDGWGYAIMMHGAHAPYDNEKSTVVACHACHKLVPERDFVFSKATFMGHSLAQEAQAAAATDFRTRFKDKALSEMSAFEKRAVELTTDKKEYEKIKYLSMELFPGSVSESIGALSQYSIRDNTIYAIINEKTHQFLVSNPLPRSPECKARARLARTMTVEQRSKPGAPIRQINAVQIGFICDGINAV